jgi:hypothetical protein
MQKKQMTETVSDITSLMTKDLGRADPGELLDHVAELIDKAFDMKIPAATSRALALLDQFSACQSSASPAEIAHSHYFRANAWANRDALCRFSMGARFIVFNKQS